MSLFFTLEWHIPPSWGCKSIVVQRRSHPCWIILESFHTARVTEIMILILTSMYMAGISVKKAHQHSKGTSCMARTPQSTRTVEPFNGSGQIPPFTTYLCLSCPVETEDTVDASSAETIVPFCVHMGLCVFLPVDSIIEHRIHQEYDVPTMKVSAPNMDVNIHYICNIHASPNGTPWAAACDRV